MLLFGLGDLKGPGVLRVRVLVSSSQKQRWGAANFLAGAHEMPTRFDWMHDTELKRGSTPARTTSLNFALLRSRRMKTTHETPRRNTDAKQ